MAELLFWGTPRWDWGVVLTSMLTGFVLLTNLVTSMVVMGKATNTVPTDSQYNRGGVFTGVSHLLSGVSGVVGMIPLSLAAAVIQTTRMASRLPFMLAMVGMMLIGLLPTVAHFGGFADSGCLCGDVHFVHAASRVRFERLRDSQNG